MGVDEGGEGNVGFSRSGSQKKLPRGSEEGPSTPIAIEGDPWRPQYVINEDVHADPRRAMPRDMHADGWHACR